MSSPSSRLRIGGAVAATSLTLVFGLGSTALADQGRGGDHGSDRASSRSGRTAPGHAGSTVTEDTDTNDGGTPNNVVDAGDDTHPSGNDRSVENGGSGNQGTAASEPDQNGSGPERDNGGVDQPGGPGGVDLADQDGNNGCGNDDDFEDDNEGLCGKPSKAGTPPTAVKDETEIERAEDDGGAVVVDAGTVAPDAVLGAQLQSETATPTQVLGVAIERPAVPTAVAAAATSRAPESGATVSRRAALARTGFGTGTMVLLALSLLLVGFTMVRRPKGAHFIA